METKRNLKYFTSTGVSPWTWAGWGILLIGAIILILNISTFAGIAVAIVGVGLLIFSTSGKASGDDIEYQVGERMRNMTERGMIRFELFEKSLKYMQPLTLRGYEFNDDVYYKKGSDGKSRTSSFSAAVLFCTGERLNIHHRHFSLIDDQIDEELGGSYKYIDLSRVEVRSFPFERLVGNRLYKVTDYHFVVIGKDGNDIFDISVDYGADIDKACDDLNRIIDIRTKAYYEKLARVEADRKARLEAVAAHGSAEA